MRQTSFRTEYCPSQALSPAAVLGTQILPPLPLIPDNWSVRFLRLLGYFMVENVIADDHLRYLSTLRFYDSRRDLTVERRLLMPLGDEDRLPQARLGRGHSTAESPRERGSGGQRP